VFFEVVAETLKPKQILPVDACHRKPPLLRKVDAIRHAMTRTEMRGVTAWTICTAGTLEPGPAETARKNVQVIQNLPRSDLRVIEERDLPHYCRRPIRMLNRGGQSY
jgi:hypothetical protein